LGVSIGLWHTRKTINSHKGRNELLDDIKVKMLDDIKVKMLDITSEKPVTPVVKYKGMLLSNKE
jgi:hypothetical protein